MTTTCARRTTRTSRSEPGASETIRCFPDKLPIGVEKDGTDHLVFLYLVNRRIPMDFRQFLIRHARAVAVRAHMDRPAARPAPLQEGRRPLQGGRPRGALDADESERDARRWRRTFPSARARADTSATRPIRYIRQRVPEAGNGEDPGAVSSVAATGRSGALAGALDQLCATIGRAAVRRCEVELLNRQYLQLTGDDGP